MTKKKDYSFLREVIELLVGRTCPYHIPCLSFSENRNSNDTRLVINWISEHARPLWASGASVAEAAELIVSSALHRSNITANEDDAHSIWESDSRDYTVELTNKAVIDISQMAERFYPFEIGTALVGAYNGNTATVTSVAPIAVDSVSEVSTFTRGNFGMNEFFDDLWQRTGGSMHYVGEWHSHTSENSEPSDLDIESMLKLARDADFNCKDPILIVSGSSHGHARDLSVAVCSRKNGFIRLNRVA